MMKEPRKLAAQNASGDLLKDLEKLRNRYVVIEEPACVIDRQQPRREPMTLDCFRMVWEHIRVRFYDMRMGLGDAYLEWRERQQYERLVVLPHKPPGMIKLRNEEDEVTCWNVWRHRRRWEKGVPGDVTLIMQALLEVCGGDEELLQSVLLYLTHMEMQPWHRPGVGLWIQGEGGDALVDLFRKIAGERRCSSPKRTEDMFDSATVGDLGMELWDKGCIQANGLVALKWRPTGDVDITKEVPPPEGTPGVYYLPNILRVLAVDATDEHFKWADPKQWLVVRPTGKRFTWPTEKNEYAMIHFLQKLPKLPAFTEHGGHVFTVANNRLLPAAY